MALAQSQILTHVVLDWLSYTFLITNLYKATYVGTCRIAVGSGLIFLSTKRLKFQVVIKIMKTNFGRPCNVKIHTNIAVKPTSAVVRLSSGVC